MGKITPIKTSNSGLMLKRWRHISYRQYNISSNSKEAFSYQPCSVYTLFVMVIRIHLGRNMSDC